MEFLNRISKSFCTKIILPCCASYERARQIFNRSIERFPCVIIYCESGEDVSAAVRYALRHGLCVRVRSGGHNYEGYCVGDGVLVIDTSRMKRANVSEEEGTVYIESGVLNEQLYRLLSQHGYPFPSGTCPTVGAAGLTQGGGWGHSARMFGLACDRLLEAKLVDAKGQLLTVNHRSHPELYWALRGGGGGNFGVVTSLTYQLPPKCGRVTYVDLNYKNVTQREAVRFFDTWQRWLRRGDIRFTPNSRIFNSAEQGVGIFLRGFYYGSKLETAASIESFLRLPGANAVLREVSFPQAVEIDASFYPKTEKFRFAGRFANTELTKKEMADLVRLIERRAPGSVYASVALYALGGKVREPAPQDTAFYYRDALFIAGVESVWEEPEAKEANLVWLQERAAALASVTQGSYINFPYLFTPDYMTAYYGKNAGRLSRIKGEYDPDNLFRFQQSIPPT